MDIIRLFLTNTVYVLDPNNRVLRGCDVLSSKMMCRLICSNGAKKVF